MEHDRHKMLEDHRHKLTLEGIADADAGRVIDHQAMVDWAKSLSTDRPLPRPEAPIDSQTPASQSKTQKDR
jgi:hypothetical protein